MICPSLKDRHANNIDYNHVSNSVQFTSVILSSFHTVYLWYATQITKFNHNLHIYEYLKATDNEILYNTYIVMDIITSKNISCVGVFNDVISCVGVFNDVISCVGVFNDVIILNLLTNVT